MPRGEGHRPCTAESRNRKTGEPRKDRGSGSASVRFDSAQSARHCGIAHTTTFRWQHRFLDASRRDAGTLNGIVEADKTYLRRSRKG